MKISKTQFKQYTRCPHVFSLDEVYRKKLNANVSFFEADRNEKIIEMLVSMFDEDSGDDLLNVANAQMDAMLPYYNAVESYSMKIAEKLFGMNIIHNRDTKKQKYFNYYTDDLELYCYLDGYQEISNDINIFEVKATTSKKFYECGPKIQKVQTSIFEKKGNIYKIISPQNIYMDESKFYETYNKLFNRYNEIGKYIFDIAIERFIIEHSSNYNKNKNYNYYLTVLNHEYVFDGLYENNQMVYNLDKNNNELIVFIDLNQITKDYQEIILQQLNNLKKYLSQKEICEEKISTFCEYKKITKCLFVPVCWKKARIDGSLLEYRDNHYGFKDKNGDMHTVYDFINSGKYKIDSIPSDWLTRDSNIIQRKCYDENKIYMNIDKIIAGVEAVKYPIYHLDFESFPSPLPRFNGEKCYAQSLFQFSIHVEKSYKNCDKEKDHLEFLAESNDIDCRLELVKKMIEYIDLTNGGTVLVYNMSFEKTRIKELAQIYPEYANKLYNINNHVFDLLDIIKGSSVLYEKLGFDKKSCGGINYYNNRLHGSFSIKKVLPIFSDLTYSGMGVANGTEAIAAYAKFNQLDESELLVLRQHLKKYCQQDTWAMVVILWGLIEETKKNKDNNMVIKKT